MSALVVASSLRAWRTKARSCWLSVLGYSSIQAWTAESSAIRRSRQLSAKCRANVSLVLPMRCSLSASLTASTDASLSLRMSLPTYCIWRRLPSKLVMRRASTKASRSWSVMWPWVLRRSINSPRKVSSSTPKSWRSSLSFLRSVRLRPSVPLSSALSSRSSSLPSATNWPRTK